LKIIGSRRRHAASTGTPYAIFYSFDDFKFDRVARSLQRSGTSRSRFSIGQSYPHARQHHFKVAEWLLIVDSNVTRPFVPHWGHFSGTLSRSGVLGTWDDRIVSARLHPCNPLPSHAAIDASARPGEVCRIETFWRNDNFTSRFTEAVAH
jgi:hypothetical protein